MIDIPLGKALVPIAYNSSKSVTRCSGCYFASTVNREKCASVPCAWNGRTDTTSVIFKLVDYPVEEKK